MDYGLDLTYLICEMGLIINSIYFVGLLEDEICSYFNILEHIYLIYLEQC